MKALQKNLTAAQDDQNTACLRVTELLDEKKAWEEEKLKLNEDH